MQNVIHVLYKTGVTSVYCRHPAGENRASDHLVSPGYRTGVFPQGKFLTLPLKPHMYHQKYAENTTDVQARRNPFSPLMLIHL